MKKGKITWRNKFPNRGVKADIAHAAVEKIRIKNGGRVTPQNLVKAAKGNKHPLHKMFDWDDKIAAQMHRLKQARDILGALKINIVVEEGEDPEVTRAFVTIESEEGYMDTIEALSNPVIARDVVAEAKAELIAWRERWKTYSKLAELCQCVSKAAGI